MIRPPSQQHEYDLFWSGDDAITKPATDATDEERALFVHRLEVARDTGDWSQIISGEPTRFRMRQVPGDVFRKLTDLSGKLGVFSLNHLIVRAALVGVSNLHGVRDVRLIVDEEHGLGRIAAPDIPNLLDAIDVGIVNELANEVARRFITRPKS